MYTYDRILLFGHDDLLLQTRGLVLQKEGFQIWIAENLEQAAETIVVRQINVLVLCQTLSSRERWEVMTMGETLQPQMKMLVIEDEFARLPPDKMAAVLESVPGPGDLISAVKRIASQRETPTDA